MIEYVKLGRDLGVDWNYILVKDVTYDFGNKYSIPQEFKNNWFWVRMKGNSLLLTVYKNYAWDGCSFVPDFKGTILASLPHDVFYQFSDELSNFWLWKLYKVITLADNLFKISMEQNETKKVIIKTYYLGVRVFGYPFRLLNRALGNIF